MAAPKRGLGLKGQGIEALIHSGINNLNDAAASDAVIEIDINKIEPNQSQPRKRFEETALEELAASIEEYGVIQPVLLKKTGDFYEIIAGERRWRAAKIAGLKKIPAIVKSYDETRAFEVALIENLQREDLNPMEEAQGYQKMAETLGLSQEQIAEKVGKSRSAVTNAIRLLHLDERVQNFVRENKISNGHARALLALADKDLQFEWAERIIEDELSVRDIERLTKKDQEPKTTLQQRPSKFHTETYGVLENQLKELLGTKVKLNSKKNKGKIEIEYYSDEDLDRIIGLLKRI